MTELAWSEARQAQRCPNRESDSRTGQNGNEYGVGLGSEQVANSCHHSCRRRLHEQAGCRVHTVAPRVRDQQSKHRSVQQDWWLANAE
jgi:hypothetical protein